MADPNCIFCRIVAGDIPSERVYEDERCIAFLDINPIAPGHTLLIPRGHHANLLETPHDVLAALMAAAPKVARAAMAATDGEGFNFFQFNGQCSGQEVFHIHFHIIPRRTGDGLGYRWLPGTYGPGELEAMQQKILDRID